MAHQTLSISYPPLSCVPEIRSPGKAKFTGKITLQVCTTSHNICADGCTRKLPSGPAVAHFMFLSIQSLKGSTLVKAVEMLWLHVLS